MSNYAEDALSRRRFTTQLVVTAASLPLMALVREAAAQLPPVSEDDPAAKALGYVHDASRVAASDRPDTTRLCNNCRFYTSDAPDWGPCTLFPNKSVAAMGWCKGWVKKA